MAKRFTIILAAGKGTRMKSQYSKVLHQVCGQAMVEHVLTQVQALQPNKIITVIAPQSQQVRDLLGDRTQYVEQAEQLGTAHAVLQTEAALSSQTGTTLIMSGDTPLFTAATLEKLLAYHENQHAQATILTAHAPNPFGYGRIIRNAAGQVVKIVEQKDASAQEQAVQEINTGVYCFDNQKLFHYLHQVQNNNAQNEYYLPDVIGLMQQQHDQVSAYQMDNFEESLGVNDRSALAQATKIMQKRINQQHLQNGVTLIDPENTMIDVNVEIGADTVIEPGVALKAGTKIGQNCYISQGSRLVGAVLEDNVQVISSTIEQSIMRAGSDIGPNSHLRPQADIGPAVHIGNFCEVKKATIGARTKIGHLSYVGDATVGSDVNIGCGVVFVNYDGQKKWHTDIGDQAFVGSNANIIAPVKISDHSFIAAGSTVTDDVPQHAMAIGRARQTNKNDYWSKLPLADDPHWR